MESYQHFKATKRELWLWASIGTILGFALGLSLWGTPIKSSSYELAVFGLCAGLAVAMIMPYKLWAWFFTGVITCMVGSIAIGNDVFGAGAWTALIAVLTSVISALAIFLGALGYGTLFDARVEEEVRQDFAGYGLPT